MSPLSQTGLERGWEGSENLWPALERVLVLPLPSAKVSVTSLARYRASRGALEQYWDDVARMLNSNRAATTCVAGVDLGRLMGVRYRHTQEYKDEVAKTDMALEQAVKNMEEAQNRRPQAAPASNAYVVPHATLDKNYHIARVEPKQKIKTRRADADVPTAEDIAAQLDDVVIQESRLRLAVSAKSKDFFDRMFCAYAAESGDVDWKSLVAAMVDAGCSAIPNTGSEVTFKDRDVNKASIVFHRPHDSIINPIMLKMMATRLRRRFDWDAETFVKREKEGGKEGNANDA
ncbi:hypothetical protein LTR10_004179 [Elasticomyces elasticus]|nr:hypothetical protein LTR10_004179 [Elasticomyces elasticus]KAK4977637.1 hypothetical protein LTR42_002008 [Elasticomyces elasticus]